MVARGQRVLVAVSGGPDSVALLTALAALVKRFEIDVYAAHLNHRLRGEESERDQRCVERAAAWCGVPMHVERVTRVPTGPNLEARSREVRYAFLARVAQRERCDRIATGHTLDDQAETVLMRVLRGTGHDGLTGIPAVRDDTYIRPLIECSRAAIITFLEKNHREYCEDSTNSDPRFLRNRVRHEVLPLLRTLNPAIAEHLALTADIAAQETAYLEEQAQALLATARDVNGGLDIGRLMAAPPALQRRVVRAWLRSVRGHLEQLAEPHFAAIGKLVAAAVPSGSVVLPRGGRVLREYDRVRFTPEVGACQTGEDIPVIVRPGMTVSLVSGWSVSAQVLRRTADMSLPHGPSTFLADAAQMPECLTVRCPRPGDRIQPLGLDGHRKLQDVFVDRKVARARRLSWPVIETEGEIVWVPELVRGARAPVTPASERLLQLTAQKTGIAGA